MTNREEWEKAAVDAGRSSGDLIHPLIYCPELHFSEFASAVADMKNSSAVCFHTCNLVQNFALFFIELAKIMDSIINNV